MARIPLRIPPILTVFLLSLLCSSCGKEPPKDPREQQPEIPATTTGSIDRPTLEGMRGEWLYGGKILNMAAFRKSEIPSDLRAVGFWANVRQAPLNTKDWRSVVLQERYRLVFTQYENHPSLAAAAIRITADSLTVPIWLTAHYTSPQRVRPLDRVHLAQDSTLEFYLGNGQIMLLKWVDSMVLSTHFSEEKIFTHDVWVRR